VLTNAGNKKKVIPERRRGVGQLMSYGLQSWREIEQFIQVVRRTLMLNIAVAFSVLCRRMLVYNKKKSDPERRRVFGPLMSHAFSQREKLNISSN
jgi:hypothetical protein